MRLILPLLILVSSVSQASEEKENKVEQRERLEMMRFFAAPAGQAQTPKTLSAVQLYNEAVEHFQVGEIDLAKQSLHASLSLNNQNAFAYRLLGEIAYREQNLKEARSQYQIAYALDPQPDLRLKLEKIGAEEKVESKFKSYDEEHFLIRYHDSDKSVDGYELREMLRQAYRQLSQTYAYYFKTKITVLLYSPEDFKRLQGVPHWSSGIYDGKVRMPFNGSGWKEKDLKALTQHELTHAFVSAMSKGRAPAWINEGLAMIEQNKVTPVDLSVLRDAEQKNRLIPIILLFQQGNLEQMTSASDVVLFYQESFSLCAYLISRYRLFAIKQILVEYGDNKEITEILRNIFDISAQRLEEDWKASF